MHRILAIALIFLAFAASAFGQSSPTSPATYKLSGDTVAINVDKSGSRHVHADGNVHLNYTIGPDTWQLSSGEADYTETRSQGDITSQTASAQTDIHITGPGIEISAPGKIDIDLLTGHLVSESAIVNVVTENGEMSTAKVEAVESPNRDVSDINIYTYQQTSASFLLTDKRPSPTEPAAGKSAPFWLFTF